MTNFSMSLCDKLGIEYPILQAGMGDVAGADLVIAVSEAGGLGVLGGAEREPEQLRQEIRRVKAGTNKPFGVDLLLAAAESEEDIVPDHAGLPAFAYGSKVRQQVDVMFEEDVPVFVSGLGNPAPFLPRARRHGMTVLSLVGTVSAARRVAAAGVDYVIAQGAEAGGHTGRVATMALVPAIRDAVDVPVLAAGGIADGRGVVAAMALGAVGVWIGTRFVATHEAHAHENFKQRILQATSSDTTITRAYTGKTARAISNEYTAKWATCQDRLKPFPEQFMLSQENFHGAMEHGDVANGFMPTGQIAGVISDLPSAGEIVRRLVDEVEHAYCTLGGHLIVFGSNQQSGDRS